MTSAGSERVFKLDNILSFVGEVEIFLDQKETLLLAS